MVAEQEDTEGAHPEEEVVMEAVEMVSDELIIYKMELWNIF